MSEPSWAWLISAANGIIIFWGVLYGVANLKASLNQSKKAMETLQKMVSDHENRLTEIETRCEIRHGTESIHKIKRHHEESD